MHCTLVAFLYVQALPAHKKHKGRKKTQIILIIAWSSLHTEKREFLAHKALKNDRCKITVQQQQKTITAQSDWVCQMPQVFSRRT